MVLVLFGLMHSRGYPQWKISLYPIIEGVTHSTFRQHLSAILQMGLPAPCCHPIHILELHVAHEGMGTKGASHRYHIFSDGLEREQSSSLFTFRPWEADRSIRRHFSGWPGWHVFGTTPNWLVCRFLMVSGSGTGTILAAACLDWRNFSTTSWFFDAEHMFYELTCRLSRTLSEIPAGVLLLLFYSN